MLFELTVSLRDAWTDRETWFCPCTYPPYFGWSIFELAYLLPPYSSSLNLRHEVEAFPIPLYPSLCLVAAAACSVLVTVAAVLGLFFLLDLLQLHLWLLVLLPRTALHLLWLHLQ